MIAGILGIGTFCGVADVHPSLVDFNKNFVDLSKSEIYVRPDFSAVVGSFGESHEGMSPVSEVYTPGLVPDGKGGWVKPPAPPTSPSSKVLNWQLSATLASKGLSFSPAKLTLAARWQYEPSFAIDGVVATALQASLGYDDAQLQALFNEAAALK